jgi:hypothetical protein
MASSPTAADAAVDHKGKEEKEKRGGVLGRMWRALFGGREDFEKRLQYLSKEEAAVHARMRRRTQFSRRAVRNLIVLSVLAEVSPLPSPPACLLIEFRCGSVRYRRVIVLVIPIGVYWWVCVPVIGPNPWDFLVLIVVCFCDGASQ